MPRCRGIVAHTSRATSMKQAEDIAYLPIGLDSMFLHTIFESDPAEHSEECIRLYLPEPVANTQPAARSSRDTQAYIILLSQGAECEQRVNIPSNTAPSMRCQLGCRPGQCGWKLLHASCLLVIIQNQQKNISLGPDSDQ